jgi:RNA polymerase sigma-70 factor (ECF subfamily)
VADDRRELVDRARAGDRAAMDELVRHYGPIVRTALQGKLAPDVHARLDTDDLFQSALTQAWRDLRTFRWTDEPSFRAWLLAVAKREVLMSARFERRQRRTPAREGGDAVAAEVPAVRTTPTAGAVRLETARHLEEAVKTLPDAERRVVELHSFRGLSFAETARLASLENEDAARYLFRRALKHLGETMADGSPSG